MENNTVIKKSFLEAFQAHVERMINRREILKPIPVISHGHNDLTNTLEDLQYIGAGLVVVVMNPIPERIVGGNDQIYYESLGVRIHVIEHAGFNNTALVPLEVAEAVSQILHHQSIDLDHWSGYLKLKSSNPWKEIKDPRHPDRYCIEIQLEAINTTYNEEKEDEYEHVY